MKDTFFYVPAEKRQRLAALYTPGKDKTIQRVDDKPHRQGNLRYSASYPYDGPKTYYSGGAGLVSTVADYGRFLQMLLGRGELNGKRLLRPETVDRMTAQPNRRPENRLRHSRRRFRIRLRRGNGAGEAGFPGVGGFLLLGRHLPHILLGRSEGATRRHRNDAAVPVQPSDAVA